MNDKNLLNHWKIVFAAVGFNLLFEYSMRGINNLLVRPLLSLFLFLAYFPYFALVENLITKYRLRDYHLLFVGFFFGIAFTLFVPATQFVEPQAFGINWFALFFVNFVWWGTIQGILTFYLANRLFPRNWRHKLPSRVQQMAFLAILIIVGLTFRISIQLNIPESPEISPSAYVIIAFLLIVTALVFWKVLPRSVSEILVHRKERFLDVLAAATIGVFVFCAFFLTHDPIYINVHGVNQTAVRVVTFWTVIVAFLMLVYRLYTRRSIPV
ncbi:MAG: hypothetical protein QHH17_03420 [Candidatus Bathyarchaeota archaeon]|nr:hypothetical protein [Candidatus Bathyarchaeota archaeon]